MTRSLIEVQAAVAFWALGDDTGMSSKALARAACHMPADRHPPYPIDTGDFGRCYRLIQEVPETREAVALLGRSDPVWARLALVWDEISARYAEEQTSGPLNRWGFRECPRTHALIKAAVR